MLMARRMALMIILLCGSLVVSACLFVGGLRAEFTATPRSGYPPLEVKFDAEGSSSPNGVITSYKWDFDADGEADASGVTIQHTFYTKGVYPVTLTVTDSTGEAATVTHNIQALSLPPVASFDYWPNMPTKDTVVAFDASDSYDPDGEIVNYIWSFGDGTSAEGEYVEHLFPQAGIQYTVRLTVIDEDGVSKWAEKTVRVIGCNTCG